MKLKRPANKDIEHAIECAILYQEHHPELKNSGYWYFSGEMEVLIEMANESP